MNNLSLICQKKEKIFAINIINGMADDNNIIDPHKNP